MSLEQILGELFFKNEEPLRLLKKHGLDQILSNSIQLIKVEIDKPTIDFTKFGHISSNILISINTRLREVNDSMEKGYLELILKDITEYLINKLILKASKPEKLIEEIDSSIQTASSINNYNYEALIRLLKLENFKNRTQKKENRATGIFYFNWNGYPHDLDELVLNLKHQQWIPTVKEFKSLFKRHNGQINVRFSRDKIDHLLALFDELKENKLITPKGCRGHFHPLSIYLVDLENNILFKNSPKVSKMIAKRNDDYWQTLLKKAKVMVAPFKVKDSLRLPSPK